ncbi:MAG: dehydrogenase [Candidatus Eremiobacteraeota bacterium]|nr:dehydrogenase [Candidatus Eremiobacteraeota bacterium]
MKATVYHGPRDLRLENVPDPSIRDRKDAIVRITRAAICGSDLWFYRGVTQLNPGAHTGHACRITSRTSRSRRSSTIT